MQRLWTCHTRGLEDKKHGERLRMLNLFSIKGRLLRADLIKCWKIFQGLCPIRPADLWDIATDSRTRGNRFKIKIRQCQLDTRAHFFSERVAVEWNLLPDWMVASGSITEFKSALPEVLGDRLFDFLE